MAKDTSLIHGRKVIDALIAAGIADNRTSRVIIDIPVNGIPEIHIQRWGDEMLLDVLAAIAKPAEVTKS